jgi:hypothetical protein
VLLAEHAGQSLAGLLGGQIEQVAVAGPVLVEAGGFVVDRVGAFEQAFGLRFGMRVACKAAGRRACRCCGDGVVGQADLSVGSVELLGQV